MMKVIFECVVDSVFAFFDRLQEKGIHGICVPRRFQSVNNLFEQDILQDISLYHILKLIGEYAKIEITLTNDELKQCTQQESDFVRGLSEYCNSKWEARKLENEKVLRNRIAEVYQCRNQCKKKIASEEYLEERFLEGAGTYFVSPGMKSFKETLLIFHAYGVKAAIWNSFVSLISNQNRVILFCPELLENTQVDNTSMDGMADNIARICKKENVGECYVLAWCSGTKLATHFLLRYKVNLCRFIILSGNFASYNEPISVLSDFEKATSLLLNIPQDSNMDKTLKLYRTLNLRKSGGEFWNSCLYYQNSLMMPYEDSTNFMKYQKLHRIFLAYRYKQTGDCLHTDIYNIYGEFDIVSRRENLKVADKVFHGASTLYLPLGSHWYFVENSISLCILLYQIECREYDFEQIGRNENAM